MINSYSKFIKHMSKAQNFFLQRENDCYYITDGYLMLKVPEIEYRYFFQPASGFYMELENGENAGKRNNDNFPQKSAGMDQAKIYNSTTAENPAKITPFSYEYIESKKKKVMRVFLVHSASGNNYISVNADYVTATIDFCGQLKSNGEIYSPLKCDDDSGHGLIIMPCKDIKNMIPAFINKEF